MVKKRDKEKNIRAVIDALEDHEDNLSDGYGYYAGRYPGDKKQRGYNPSRARYNTMRSVARAILKALGL